MGQVSRLHGIFCTWLMHQAIRSHARIYVCQKP